MTHEDLLLYLYEMRFKGELRNVLGRVRDLKATTKLEFKTEIWNDHCQVSLVNAAKYWTQHFVLSTFRAYQPPASLAALFTMFLHGYGGYFLQEET